MKKIAFILSFILISLFSISNAQTSGPNASATARQFGYYVAYGDAMKSSHAVVPETDMSAYVDQKHSEIEELGGLAKIVIGNEEVVNENTVKVSLIFVCKKEDATVKETYTLLKENGTWKIAADKL